MKDCIIIDLETTEGENPKVNELGAVLYSIDKQCIISCYSCLVSTNPEAQLSEPNTISQIDPWAVEWYGIPPHWIKNEIGNVFGVGDQKRTGLELRDSDLLIAHNVEHEQKYISHPNWLCTFKDFDLFPENYVGRRDLFSMAIANGVGIAQGHRAIYDCLLIAEVFNRRPNLKTDFERAMLPDVELIAPKDDPMAKGWRWDYNKQGWFAKDFGDRHDPENQIAHLMIPDGPRQKMRVIGGYEIREIAKFWGFQWNAEKRYWQKLVNPEAVDLYPFPLAVLEE